MAPRTWVAIDIAKGINVVLVEHPDGQRQRFRFEHRRDDYHRTLAYQLVSEGFDEVILRLHKQGTTHHISRVRTQLQHVLIMHYLTLYFPEIERFWSTPRNEWLIRLPLQFPTPTSIAALSVEEFRNQIRKSMGRRVHKQAAHSIPAALLEAGV